MSKPTPGEPIKRGDELTHQWLNEPLERGDERRMDLDPSSGLEGYSGPAGTGVRAKRSLEFTAKITGAPTGTAHPFTQQVTTAAGTFANGPRTGSAYGTSLTTSTLTNKIVRVYWANFCYWFESC